jgi:hypothetical protein
MTQSITLWLNQFLPSTFVGDLSFWLLFFGASLGLGLYLGRSQLVNVVLYGYISLALIGNFPAMFFSFSLIYGKAIFFGGLLILMILVGNYLFDIHIPNAGSDFFWRILMMGFLATGMILSIALTLLPKREVLQYMSLTSYQIFADPWSFVAWLTLPLVFLWIINKRLN